MTKQKQVSECNKKNCTHRETEINEKQKKTQFKRPKDAMMTTEQEKICTTNIDSKEWV